MAEQAIDIDQFDMEVPMEEQEDGSFLIGTPNEDELGYDEGATLREWDDNLASDMDVKERVRIGSEMLEHFDDDSGAREDWLDVYKDGLKSLKPENVHDSGTVHKLSQVIHPMVAEAATQFQARAISELFPPSGPVGTLIIGEPTKETQEQANRVRTYMNYQLTEEMEEYFPDLDQMLFHLPLVGHCFKKSWFDVNLRRITSRFIEAEYLVVEPNATDLETASRYHHQLFIPRHQYREYVQNDFYDEVLPEIDSQPEQTTVQDIEGISPNNEEAMVELIESHVYYDADEGFGEVPYIITTHVSSKQVVGIRRNWEEDDPKFRKHVWFTSYKFLPGLGFYGFGLYHVIGGLGKTATGALRSLLDAAAFANMQGGFKLRGRVQGGEIKIAPGEFTDLSASVDDIKKAVMPLPFKEPSPTMMSLLQYVVETGKQYANTVATNISDANQNTPVGTTMALLEENSRVFSAVHKRLHSAQRHEFKVIAKLNGIYLPERYPYRQNSPDFVLRADFDDRLDIIPVSDPSTFSSTQRISQAQAMLQMATQYPQYHNQYAALRRMYDALRVPNFDEVLINPSNAERLDAVGENTFIMLGKPVKAFEDQDHMAHLTVLDDWYKRLDPQLQQIHGSGYISHRAEHTALFYRAMMQQQMAAPLPPLSGAEDDITPIDPMLDKQISQAAAQIVTENPQPMIGPPPPQIGGPENDPLASAKMLAEAEAMSIKAKTQADIESRQLKAQADLKIKMADAQMDMQIELIKLKTRMEETRMREEGRAENDSIKLNAQLDALWEKAETDIGIASMKANQQLDAEALRQQQQQEMKFDGSE